MELSNLKPMTDLECEQINGGFLPLLFAAIAGAIAVPVIKNLWNSISGNIKLPGGIEAKWDHNKKNGGTKDHDKEIEKFEKEIEKWEAKMAHLVPPFYEF